jgi:hypothetical protein
MDKCGFCGKQKIDVREEIVLRGSVVNPATGKGQDSYTKKLVCGDYFEKASEPDSPEFVWFHGD